MDGEKRLLVLGQKTQYHLHFFQLLHNKLHLRRCSRGGVFQESKAALSAREAARSAEAAAKAAEAAAKAEGINLARMGW